MVMGRIPPAVVIDYFHKIKEAPVVTRVTVAASAAVFIVILLWHRSLKRSVN